MHICHRVHVPKTFAAILFLLVGVLNLSPLQAQTAARERQPESLPPLTNTQMNITESPFANETSTYYCGGFIELNPAARPFEIVGGEQEQEQNTYATGDYLYISAGAQQGLKAGQEFSVVRPRGSFTSKFTLKYGTLGVFTQEIGRLRLTAVKDRVSVALVIGSCEMILLGDLLRAVPAPMSKASETQVYIADDIRTPAMNRFSEATRRKIGRIVLARDGREMLAANQVVYVDLGREDNVNPGDLFTIYRPVGTGNITRPQDEISANKVKDFESEEFRGGTFSNKAQRARNPSGTKLNDQDSITSGQIKKRRPALPRKIVGELVIINIEERTATALITRTAQEVHTGDYLERR